MKRVKYGSVLLVTLAVLLCGAAVAGAAGTRVLATTFPVWMMVRNITAGLDGVEVDIMVPAVAGCPHDYALGPQDMRKLEAADVVVMNGLGLDDFILKPVGNRAEASLPLLVDASLAVPEAALLGGHVHGQEPDEKDLQSHPSHRHEANPHLFASPARMAAMAEYTATCLASALPEQAEALFANAATWSARLRSLAEDFAHLGERVRGRGIMTQHSAFDYLAVDSGLELAGSIQAHEGQEPSAADMLRLNREIREGKAAAIFTEPQYSERAGAVLARENKLPLAVLDPVAGGPADAPLDYYEIVMRRNLKTLESVLVP